jgi:uncharacterized protein (TIGR03086 family)
MLDLEPATRVLSRVVGAVRDEQLPAPTPCRDTSVADLLDHVDGLALAFTHAARKTQPPGGSRPPVVDGSRLPPDWRTRIPGRLADLAAAWRAPDAWTGMTTAGGVELPGDAAGRVAVNEIVVHAWDIAVATGQEVAFDPALVAAALEFVAPTAERSPGGVPGLFGPPLPVPGDARPLDRLLALTGRDPAWRAVATDV